MTEHTDELTKERAEGFVRECIDLSDESFLFIPGFEVPYKVNAEGREGALGYKVNAEGREGALGHKHAHVLMIGQRVFYKNYAPTIVELREWTKTTPFVVLAHPVRNDFLVDDGLLAEIDALEIWNQQYEGKRVPRIRSLKLFEMLRRKKPTLVATGGLDFHRREHFGTPLVQLAVAQLTEMEIIEQLCTGAFTIVSESAHVEGILLNVSALISKHRIESHLSVAVIVLGKLVNKILAGCGISLPKRLKQIIRKRI
jgi:hypothetical protein